MITAVDDFNLTVKDFPNREKPVTLVCKYSGHNKAKLSSSTNFDTTVLLVLLKDR